MSSEITLNLGNGQEIEIPFEVSGTAVGEASVTLAAAAKQIDSGPTDDIGNSCSPALPDDASPPTSVDFNFFLTRNDCPDVDTFYVLSVLVWDNGAQPSLSQKSVTFKTVGGASRI